MELRSGAMPEFDPHAPGVGNEPVPTAMSWRVAPALTVFKGLGVLIFVGAAVLFAADVTRLVMAGLAAALLGAFALRDLLAPVRLTADTEGVTVVSGYAGRRRLPWSDIERVRVDERRRLGARSELLEIDTGESLHLLSTYELSAPVADVADALNRLRRSVGR